MSEASKEDRNQVSAEPRTIFRLGAAHSAQKIEKTTMAQINHQTLVLFLMLLIVIVAVACSLASAQIVPCTGALQSQGLPQAHIVLQELSWQTRTAIPRFQLQTALQTSFHFYRSFIDRLANSIHVVVALMTSLVSSRTALLGFRHLTSILINGGTRSLHSLFDNQAYIS